MTSASRASMPRDRVGRSDCGAARGRRLSRQRDRPIDAAQVLAAIDRGVAYLKREQSPRGRWNEMAGYDGGVTALCTLALLELRRRRPTIPSIAAGARTISAASNSTRPTPSRCKRWSSARPSRRRTWSSSAAMSAGSKRIRSKRPIARAPGRIPARAATTATRSSPSSPCTTPSASASTVSRETWELAADYWRTHAERRRLLGLRPRRRRHRQHDLRRHRRPGHLPRPRSNRATPPVEERPRRLLPPARGRRPARARHRLARPSTSRSTHNPRPAGGGQPCLYYYLYGLERAGRLTARRFIGDHDWYREGAEFLVREQDSLSHYWKGTLVRRATIRTSAPPLALLFLSKGRRPDRHGQGQVRRRRRLEPASPRRGQPHRVHRRSMGPRPHLASDGPGQRPRSKTCCKRRCCTSAAARRRS